MLRRARRIVLLLGLAAVVGGGAVALTSRPDLDRARREAEQRFAVVGDVLDTRYETLAAANDVVRTAGGGDRDVVRDLDAGLAAWRTATAGGAAWPDTVRAANDLEGLARRLEATVAASPVLAEAPAVAVAIEAFRGVAVPGTVRSYQEAVRSYEDARGGALRRLVADLLGFESLPVLDLDVPSA